MNVSVCGRRGGPLPVPIFMYEGKGQGPLRGFSVWVGVVSASPLIALGTDSGICYFTGILFFTHFGSYFE